MNATYKGVITSLIMIAVSVVFFYQLQLPVNGSNQFFILMIFVAGILWTLISYNSTRPASAAGFKDFFSEGFKTFIVVALFMAAYTFIFYKLNPQILENSIKENNTLVLKEGNHTPAEIDENATKLRNIFMPMMLAINTIKYLFLGSLMTLLITAFLRKRKFSNNV